MKISIITVSYNSAETIEDTIRSVVAQDHPDIEYIIVDGASKDATPQIIDRYRNHIATYISEPDKGIYDAMNKGVLLATGDWVGILNSDDFYADSHVLSDVAQRLKETGADGLYGDLVYVDRTNTDHIVRSWKAGDYKRGQFIRGWMPPHPAFFLKREIYMRHGLYQLSLKSAADYELMLRMIHKHKISVCYLPRVITKMRTGGMSNASIKNRLRANKEDRLAWKMNDLTPAWYTLIWKPMSKVLQFLR